jgi:glycogen debranching enzyme
MHERHETPVSSSFPARPLLDWRELWPDNEEPPDLRDQLPEEQRRYLGPHDRVVCIDTPDIHNATLPPSTLRELPRLFRVDRIEQIGQNGAPVAGLSSVENLEVAALRKFEVAHGRDALKIALDIHQEHPEGLRATLLELAATQGLEDETYIAGLPFGHEEPGRIILLDREPDDPIGQKFSHHLNWAFPFYGSIDATPTFVSAIARYIETQNDTSILDQTFRGKDGMEHTMADALDRSVGWVLRRLEENPEGLLEFYNPDESGKGMASQAWKDSPYAYMHADGTRANHEAGIASVEVQAYAYDALCDAADLYDSTDSILASRLRERAAELRQKIFDTFWIEHPQKGEFFALATDRDENGRLRTLNVRTSNMGRLLNTRLLESDDPQIQYMRDQTIRQLFTPEMFGYAGFRTMASDEVAYDPNSYHTGSVWQWDVDEISNGLERHKQLHLAWIPRRCNWRVFQETGKFTEFVGGHADAIHTNPSEVYVYNTQDDILRLLYQPPQEIQGWSVSGHYTHKRNYDTYKSLDKIPYQELEREIITNNPHIQF